MKKTLYVLMAGLVLFGATGCEKVKNSYKEGVYEASVVDDYNDEGNIASAKVTINSDGKIEKIFLDTTYTTDEGVTTTKKTLGNDYNMKTYYPDAAGEWYEQVEKLEQAIVKNNGVDFITLDSDNKTDAVSGCTIKVNALVEAARQALEQAK